MNAEDLEVRADHSARIVLSNLSPDEDVGGITLDESLQRCVDTVRREFPALTIDAQASVADRTQLLLIRIWMDGFRKKSKKSS